jgi:hypothetical protein
MILLHLYNCSKANLTISERGQLADRLAAESVERDEPKES